MNTDGKKFFGSGSEESSRSPSEHYKVAPFTSVFSAQSQALSALSQIILSFFGQSEPSTFSLDSNPLLDGIALD